MAEYVDVEDCIVEACTKLAILVRITANDPDPVWIPRSVVENAEDVEPGPLMQTIGVKKWFVEKEELL